MPSIDITSYKEAFCNHSLQWYYHRLRWYLTRKKKRTHWLCVCVTHLHHFTSAVFKIPPFYWLGGIPPSPYWIIVIPNVLGNQQRCWMLLNQALQTLVFAASPFFALLAARRRSFWPLEIHQGSRESNRYLQCIRYDKHSSNMSNCSFFFDFCHNKQETCVCLAFGFDGLGHISKMETNWNGRPKSEWQVRNVSSTSHQRPKQIPYIGQKGVSFISSAGILYHELVELEGS